jgi:hypothetical protein
MFGHPRDPFRIIVDRRCGRDVLDGDSCAEHRFGEGRLARPSAAKYQHPARILIGLGAHAVTGTQARLGAE